MTFTRDGKTRVAVMNIRTYTLHATDECPALKNLYHDLEFFPRGWEKTWRQIFKRKGMKYCKRCYK